MSVKQLTYRTNKASKNGIYNHINNTISTWPF